MRSDAAIAQIPGRLLDTPQPMPDARDLKADFIISEVSGPPVPAAVLIALVRREQGYTVLYTERATSLRAHSGQVAFPGGRIDPEDKDAAHAALREANEEVALDPADASVLGYMPFYFTGTNYFITPVVAVVEPSGPFLPIRRRSAGYSRCRSKRLSIRGAMAGSAFAGTARSTHRGRSIMTATRYGASRPISRGGFATWC